MTVHFREEIEPVQLSIIGPPQRRSDMTKEFFDGIDWNLLREQKRALIEATYPRNTYNGLIHLLDAMQDYAVDVLGYSEDEIFDTEETEN